MARRRTTLRRLPGLSRRVARLSDQLGSLKKKLDRLIPEITSACMSEKALFRAGEQDRILLTEKGLEEPQPFHPAKGHASQGQEEDHPQAVSLPGPSIGVCGGGGRPAPGSTSSHYSPPGQGRSPQGPAGQG